MKKNLLPLVFISTTFFLNAQPTIQWTKNYFGNNSDNAAYIKPTKDAGYIICGSSASNDKDVTKNYGNLDCCVVKISSVGQMEWQKKSTPPNNLQRTFII